MKEDLFRADEEIERLRIVERIMEIRKKAGLSQKDLALRIGESEAFVQQLESKRQSIQDITLLIRIAQALGCQLEINFRHPEGH